MQRNTKMKFILLNFALLFVSNSALAQNITSHFKSEIDFGNGTVISTFLDVAIAQNQFTITSPKNADVRMVGGFKARMGRLMGKLPKKGIIITVKGEQRKDSLFGETKIPMFGKLKFKGIANNQTLSGELLNSDGIAIGTLQGVHSTDNKISYTALYPQLLKTIQDHIYSKDALQTKEWATFKKDFEKLSATAHDDIELFFGFNIISRKLPFTHLSLMISEEVGSQEKEETPNTNRSVIFEEKNAATAYLQIKNFSSSEKELSEILPKIVANSAYKNLIIDLRNNGGGGVGPAFELAKHIATEDIEVGYFPTNKLDYSGFQRELFNTLPELQPKSTEDFGNELRTSPGVKLIFKKPSNPVFNGNIYILTNGGTGSTCEPIVYALKTNKKATVIGQKTAGAMLAASPFYVSKKYMLMVPIADFYTHDGIRLDKVGVDPDIKTPSDDAANKALEIINANKS